MTLHFDAPQWLPRMLHGVLGYLDDLRHFREAARINDRDWPAHR